jgi:hypothetical protein
MAQADSEDTTDAPASPQESFATLAAPSHPAWHQAILRLASASERMAQLSGWVVSNPQDNDPESTYAANVRELVDYLIEFLDGIDPDLEPSVGFMNGPAMQDECEIPEDAEPSLARSIA